MGDADGGGREEEERRMERRMERGGAVGMDGCKREKRKKREGREGTGRSQPLPVGLMQPNSFEIEETDTHRHLTHTHNKHTHK